MAILRVGVACGVAVIVVVAGLVLTPLVFTDRVLPSVWLDSLSLAGTGEQQLPGVLQVYEQELLAQTVQLRLDDTSVSQTLGELGFSVDIPATAEHALAARPVFFWRGQTVATQLKVDPDVFWPTVRQALASQLNPPRNATLLLTPADQLVLVKSTSGEDIDWITAKQDIAQRVASGDFTEPVELTLISTAAAVQDNEVESARAYASELLRDGLKLTFEDKTFTMPPFTVRRLLQFGEQADPARADNVVLGVTFDAEGLQDYLTTTIAPGVNRMAQNARFEVVEDSADDKPTAEATNVIFRQAQNKPFDEIDGLTASRLRVKQFAVAQQGLELDVAASSQSIAEALVNRQPAAQLVVHTIEPDIGDLADIQTLGVTSLLARGQSDFAGSPRNRIHNIAVGASRYHGLLIPPGAEFSFNKFLGPVDGAHGFKPELVIKTNVTVPEFGGGLCQVSTTAFRAAVNSGLQITQRRNHSYAVSYYGTPGFDATIYPPYTDFRFLNNTPGHILIQTKIEGTSLIFEFWGTDDGRQVTVDGPHPYHRQPSGAVKATLKQTVMKDAQVIVEDTFYSNYKSPKLFPKVLAANNEPAPGSSPAANEQPISQPSPNPAPPTVSPNPPGPPAQSSP